MSDTDLRTLAEAATPGPWGADVREDGHAWVDLPGIDGHGWGMHGWGDNAAFIAAANPTVLLALLDEVEALRGAVERVGDVLARAEQRQPAMDPRTAGVYVSDIRAALADPA